MTARWHSRLGILYAASVAVWFLLQPIRALRHPTAGVYIYPVTASRILTGGSRAIYSPALQRDTASAYLHTPLPPSDLTNFAHPPLEALLLAPISHFGIHISYLIFTAVSLVLVALGALFLFRSVIPPHWDRSTKIVVATVSICTLPAATGLWGDWSPMLLLPAVGAVFLSQRRSFAAGLCLGVLLLRPPLVWLLPVMLVTLQQWRMLAGMSVGAFFWVLSTFLILGPSHVMDFPRAVWQADLSGANGYSLGIPGAFAAAFDSPALGYLMLGLSVAATVAIALRWRADLARNPALAVAIGVCLSMSVAPHIEPWDFILLAPAMCLWARANPNRAIFVSVALNILQVLTFNEIDGVVQHLIFLVPIGLVAGLIVEAVKKPPAPAVQRASA
jgi:Glycosyltransferase family 87